MWPLATGPDDDASPPGFLGDLEGSFPSFSRIESAPRPAATPHETETAEKHHPHGRNPQTL